MTDERKAVTANEIDVPEDAVEFIVANGTYTWKETLRRILAKFIAWQLNNPQVPTLGDYKEFIDQLPGLAMTMAEVAIQFTVWRQRRMYLRPTPAVHPEIQALLLPSQGATTAADANRRILEASEIAMRLALGKK